MFKFNIITLLKQRNKNTGLVKDYSIFNFNINILNVNLNLFSDFAIAPFRYVTVYLSGYLGLSNSIGNKKSSSVCGSLKTLMTSWFLSVLLYSVSCRRHVWHLQILLVLHLSEVVSLLNHQIWDGWNQWKTKCQ